MIQEKYIRLKSRSLCTKCEVVPASAFSDLEVLGGPADLGVAAVEDDESGLEGDIAVDGSTDAGVALETTEAGLTAVVVRGEVQVRAGDGEISSLDVEGEVRKLGVAREGVTAGLLVVLGAIDTAIVVLENGIGEEQEGGTGIGDTGDGVLADRGVEGPPAGGAVNRSIGDLAGVGVAVNVTEVVGAGC